LFLGLLFGSIGMGFFVYGKKQGKIIPIICGLSLMVYPYFISNSVVVILIGALLTVIPYFVRV